MSAGILRLSNQIGIIYEVSRILFFVSPSQTIRWRRKEVLAEVDHRRIECPLIHLPTGRTFHLGKKC